AGVMVRAGVAVVARAARRRSEHALPVHAGVRRARILVVADHRRAGALPVRAAGVAGGAFAAIAAGSARRRSEGAPAVDTGVLGAGVMVVAETRAVVDLVVAIVVDAVADLLAAGRHVGDRHR